MQKVWENQRRTAERNAAEIGVKMKRLCFSIALNVVLLCIVIVLCGAVFESEEVSARSPQLYVNRMKYVGSSIYVDTETGICYLHGSGAYTLMLDHDGMPFVANGWRDYDD